MISDKKFVYLPAGIIARRKMANAFLSKPANFAATFLAQGASLKPYTVAMTVLDGVLATGPSFCMYTPEGAPLTWSAAAAIVRAYAKIIGRYEHSLFVRCEEEISFRCFQREAPRLAIEARRASAKKLAAHQACAKRLAAKKAAARAELQARRAVGATKKSALRRSLKKKASRAGKRATRRVVPADSLSAIFPFSSSLFSAPPPVKTGVAFDPPSMVDHDSMPPLVVGFNKVHYAPQMVADATQYAAFLAVEDRAAYASFWCAFQSVPLWCNHRIFYLRKILSLLTEILHKVPSVLGTYFGFEHYSLSDAKSVLASIEVFIGSLGSINHMHAHTFFDTLKGVGSSLKGAASYVKEKASFFCASSLHKVLDMLKQPFLKIVSPYLAQAHSLGEEILKFWEKCVQWASSIWEKAHLVLQALGVYAIWALVLTILCGIMYLIESLLVATSVITTHGVLVSIFLSAVLVIFGFTVFTLGRESAELIHAIRQSIAMSVIPPMEAEKCSNVAEPHSAMDTVMAPVKFLEAIGSTLNLFSTSGVVAMGKYGNALEGIRKGYNCLTDFISFFLTTAGQVWETISGKKTAFFGDLARCVRVNIPTWLKDTRHALEYFEMAGSMDKFEYEKIRVLIYQGEDLVDSANRSRSSYSSSNFLRTAGKLLDDLKDIRARSARSLRFDGWRRTPFWVYVYGESQCGKSTLVNYLAPELLAHKGRHRNDAYSKDPTDQYWSGYYQQDCLKINDLSAVASKTAPFEQQLIGLISTEEQLVSSAEITGKGVQYNSELVISSSNVSTAPTNADLLDPDAYALRRKALLQCRRAVEWVHNDDGTKKERTNSDGSYVQRQYLPHDALSCTEVRWLHPKDETSLPGNAGEWHLASHTIPLLKEAMDNHFETEDAKRANWAQKMHMQSNSGREISSYLQSALRQIVGFQRSQSDGAEGKISAGDTMAMVAVDGKVYLIDPAGNATLAGGAEFHDNIPNLEHITQHHYKFQFIDTVRAHCSSFIYRDNFHSSMVRDFLDDMLEKEACVLSVDKISKDTKEMHRELWNELTLADKVFLRISQVALNKVRDQPHFKEDLTARFLESASSFVGKIVEHREKLLMFVVGLALVGIFSHSFLALFRSLTGGGLTVGSAMAIKAQMDVHSSSISSGSVVSSFTQASSRNIPIVWAKAARYANAHSQIEDTHGNFNFFHDGLGYLLVRLVGTSGQSETAALFGSRTLVLCAHQIRMFPNFDRVTVNYFGKDQKPRCFTITWHWENAILEDDNECCLYRDDQLTCLPVYSDSLYLQENEKLPTCININGVFIKKRKFFEEKSLTPDEQLLEGETPLVRTVSNTAVLTKQKLTITYKQQPSAYYKEIGKYYLSSYPCGVHDSGGLITTMKDGRRIVVGIHAAGIPIGANFSASICFLPRRNVAYAHSAPDFFEPAQGRKERGFEKIGYIANPSMRPHAASKTQLARVPDQLALPLPAGVDVKIPAILSKNDPRLQTVVNPAFKDYDPLKNGMDKFANPALLLDETILQEVCEDIVETWFDCLPGEDEKELLEKVSLDVALNGLPDEEYYDPMRLDTSEGYPYVLERKPGDKGKFRYVDVSEEGHKSLIEGTSVYNDYQSLSTSIVSSVPVLNCIETPKDEPLAATKVLDEPKTRLFDILPFVHNILLREYFLSFCVFLQNNRSRLPCAVGVNPYSMEWTYLLDDLAQVSDKALNCDYSKFDGLITNQIYVHMVSIINRLFKKNDRDSQARINLFKMFVGRRSIAFDQVYMVQGGMPSGCALTVIINSIFNEMLIRYVYKKVTPHPMRCYFSRFVRLKVYGDDNLIAISDEVTEFFDGPVIQAELAAVSIKITDGSDKSAPTLERKPLESLDFLKRGFRKLGNGCFAAPLDKKSLYTRLYYCNAGEGGMFQNDILHDNVKSFLEELTLHANFEPEFYRVRNFYVSKVPQWANSLPTVANAVQMMESQRTKAKPYRAQAMLEVKLDGSQKKMMAGQDNCDQCIYVTPRMAVCGFKYTPQSRDTSFIVSIDTPLKLGERGIFVRNEYGVGRGQLPLESWIKKFSSRKSCPALFQAYDEGETIYFRSVMPYYNGWCALIQFAIAHNFDRTSMLALYSELKSPKAGDLSILFAHKEQRRSRIDPLVAQGILDKFT
uniref:RNA1 polyprotein n=1 Tax=Mirobolan latent ringspot virus TaxID=3072196 RepID=A0AA51MZH5_9SECO|nr:polyprotein [Mirobolan latent ringspot virus]